MKKIKQIKIKNTSNNIITIPRNLKCNEKKTVELQPLNSLEFRAQSGPDHSPLGFTPLSIN